MKSFKLLSTIWMALLGVSVLSADDFEILNRTVAVDGNCQYKRIAVFNEHVNSSTPNLLDPIVDIAVMYNYLSDNITPNYKTMVDELKKSLQKCFPANTIRGMAMSTETLPNGNFLTRDFAYWGETMPDTAMLKFLPAIDDKVNIMELARQTPQDVLVMGYLNGNLGAGLNAILASVPEVQANYEVLKESAMQEHGIDISFMQIPEKSDVLFYISLVDLSEIETAPNKVDAFHAEIYLTTDQLKGIGLLDGGRFRVTASPNGSIIELKDGNNGAKLSDGCLADDKLFLELVNALPTQDCSSFIYVAPNNLSEKYMKESSKILTGLVALNVTETGMLSYVSSKFPIELLESTGQVSGKSLEKQLTEALK